MYGKHFESMYTGSMFGVGPTVFAVWGYVISHTKKDGCVELNPHLLGAMIGCPPKEIEDAITFLCGPDERSRSKDEGGRRMIREGEFDYRVVNFISYRNILNEDERRAYNRQKKRESRERLKSKGQSLTVNDKSAVSAQAEAAPTPTPSLTPAEEAASPVARPKSTALAQPDEDMPSDVYYRHCTITLNEAMAENPTLEGGWIPVTASSQIGRVTWLEDGIPLEVAGQVIRERTEAYQSRPQARGPMSLKYFDAAVREQWERGRMTEKEDRVRRAFEK